MEARGEPPAGKWWKHLKSQSRNTHEALLGQQDREKMRRAVTGTAGREVCPEEAGKGRPQAVSSGYSFPGKKQHISKDYWSSLKYLPHWCHGLKETVHNTQ